MSLRFLTFGSSTPRHVPKVTLSTAVGEFLHLIGKDQLESYDQLKAVRDSQKDTADEHYYPQKGS
jgi:hypothetical protein